MDHTVSARLIGVALVFGAVLGVSQPAASQSAEPAIPTGPLTLEQVLTLAEARSETIAIARAGVSRAEGEQVRARSGRYPQLNASASYDRALASEFEGLFDGGSAAPCPPFSPNPAAPLGDRVAEIERALDCGAIGNPFAGASDDGGELPFGRENTWRVNLLFSQNLYSGGRLGALADLAEAGRTNAELGLITARAQLLFDVTQAYYDAALSDRLVEIAEASVRQAEATVQQVQASYRAGTQPEFELLRARVARETQIPLLIRQRANRDVALLRLKQLLDRPADAPLELAASLDDAVLAPPPAFAERLASVEMAAASALQMPVAPPELPDRTVVQEAAAAVRLREAALKAAEAERMPSVTLTSSYGRVAYPSGLAPGFDDFRTNWSVGASVQVPILTGGRLRGDRLVAQAELAETRQRLTQARELAALDTRSTWAELLAARAAWEASGGTVQQAVRAHEIAEVRYRAGVSTQLELSDARLLLQQAEANRAQAARDLQVARARTALLPELPLSPGGGFSAPGGTPALPSPVVPAAPAPAGGGQFRNAAATPSGQGR